MCVLKSDLKDVPRFCNLSKCLQRWSFTTSPWMKQPKWRFHPLFLIHTDKVGVSVTARLREPTAACSVSPAGAADRKRWQPTVTRRDACSSCRSSAHPPPPPLSSGLLGRGESIGSRQQRRDTLTRDATVCAKSFAIIQVPPPPPVKEFSFSPRARLPPIGWWRRGMKWEEATNRASCR